jgi:serine/threonine protein kinase
MVCKMAHQLLCALVTLRGLRIIHADLKPENVALTSPNRPRIKLLDFGSCCFASEEASNQFPYIQSRYYRAPEVLLGTGYGCEIDMWSFGCVVVELYLGKPLFIGDTTTQQLYKIMDVIDAPPDVIIRQSAHWSRFFKKAANPIHPIHGLGGYERLVAHDASSADLRTLITSKQEPNQPQHIEYFVDFVERILRWDPTTRMTPLDALNHNFILHGPRGLAPGSAAPPRQ